MGERRTREVFGSEWRVWQNLFKELSHGRASSAPDTAGLCWLPSCIHVVPLKEDSQSGHAGGRTWISEFSKALRVILSQAEFWEMLVYPRAEPKSLHPNAGSIHCVSWRTKMNIPSQETQSEGRKVDKWIKVSVIGALIGLCTENYGDTEGSLALTESESPPEVGDLRAGSWRLPTPAAKRKRNPEGCSLSQRDLPPFAIERALRLTLLKGTVVSFHCGKFGDIPTCQKQV